MGGWRCSASFTPASRPSFATVLAAFFPDYPQVDVMYSWDKYVNFGRNSARLYNCIQTSFKPTELEFGEPRSRRVSDAATLLEALGRLSSLALLRRQRGFSERGQPALSPRPFCPLVPPSPCCGAELHHPMPASGWDLWRKIASRCSDPHVAENERRSGGGARRCGCCPVC